ncbi:MAG: hypothetical protein AAFO82_18010 [Bacteroidota bacterium]
MTILDKIVAQKKIEVAQQKERYTLKDFERSPLFQRTTHSFSAALKVADKLGIISEFKRHSPSQGDIHADASIKEVTQGRGGRSVSTFCAYGYPFFQRNTG